MINKPNFYKLYNKTKRLTNNFKDINAKIIKTNPEILLILRSILNLSQKRFSNILNISQSYLWSLEYGISNPSNDKIQNMIYNFNKNFAINSPRKEVVYSNYKILIKQNKLTTNRAKQIRKLINNENERGVNTMAYRPPINQFEKEIYKLLKTSGITFKTNFPIKAKTKIYVVDFCIFKNNKPIAIIEVKQTHTRIKKRVYDMLKQFAIRIDHTSRNIKLKDKNIKTIAILSSKSKSLIDLTKPVYNEFIDTDKVFHDKNKNEVIEYIKSLA
jgi:transcriptional regulator with XRE-family HTH domain